MFGRIEETWETIHTVDVVLPSNSADADGRIFSLFELFYYSPGFEKLFIEKIKFYGWNVKIPHRSGPKRVFLFHEPLKNVLYGITLCKDCHKIVHKKQSTRGV